MIIDFDDFSESNNRLDLLHKLKEANPLFKCTVFAIPADCSVEFIESLPEWIELAVHGWEHPHPRECENWTYEQMIELLNRPLEGFVKGFKAPGWQISDGCYKALLERGYWVADQPYNDDRRPVDLPVYKVGANSWHGHIQNVCGNGLEERFLEILELGTNQEFKFISEVINEDYPNRVR